MKSYLLLGTYANIGSTNRGMDFLLGAVAGEKNANNLSIHAGWPDNTLNS